MTVMPVSVSSAATRDSAGVFSPSLSLKKLLCVFSWNSRYAPYLHINSLLRAQRHCKHHIHESITDHSRTEKGATTFSTPAPEQTLIKGSAGESKGAHRMMRRMAMACDRLVRVPVSTRSSP